MNRIRKRTCHITSKLAPTDEADGLLSRAASVTPAEQPKRTRRAAPPVEEASPEEAPDETAAAEAEEKPKPKPKRAAKPKTEATDEKPKPKKRAAKPKADATTDDKPKRQTRKKKES